MISAGELVIEVACEAIPRDKDVGLAAETPAQGGVRLVAGTGGGQ